MAYSIVRRDLNKVYRFNEYNEAIAYAKKNIDVKGVKEEMQNLQKEAQIYKKDISAIVDPERENEERKYNILDKWFKAKKICKWTLAGLFIVSIVNLIFGGFLPSFLHNALYVLWLFVILMLPAFLVTKIGEKICDKSYYDLIEKIDTRVIDRNESFAKKSRAYYEAIDNLYLLSLDPTLRVMVTMQREQAERDEQHRKEMKEMKDEVGRLQKELQRAEDARRRDAEQARKAQDQARKTQERALWNQERLLQIEEDRERRIRK